MSAISLQADVDGLPTRAACSLISNARLVLIGGPTCSGKTTLGRALADNLGGLFISGDDWALPEHEIAEALGYLDLESTYAYDLPNLVTCVRSLLETGRCWAPRFDFKADRVLPRVEISLNNRAALILEFIHALSPTFLTSLKTFRPLTIFVNTEPCLCLLRRVD